MHLNLDQIDPKARIFLLTNGDVLVTSSQTWQDLPITGPRQPEPDDDWRYARDCRRVGPVFARHFWRQRNGRSYFGVVAIFLRPSYANTFPRWKRSWWSVVDWIFGA